MTVGATIRKYIRDLKSLFFVSILVASIGLTSLMSIINNPLKCF